MIVAGYHYWGEQVLDRLRGMFAFVIWDRRSGGRSAPATSSASSRCTTCRPPTGSTSPARRRRCCRSRPRPRRATPGSNTANLSHYLTLQYVPEPGTLHQGISRIGSGEYLTWTPGRADRRPGGTTGRASGPTPVDDPQTLYDRIRETLRESVRLHMRSDVPVGAFLSSGIDSTAVVALAREFNPNILTFTVGYDVPGYSEIEVAQDSARHLDVTTIPTKIGPQDMMDALPKIVWHLDDPVADPALVPLYFVAKKAAEHVTVVLSGEGADEFFGGYTIYREPLSLAAVNGLPDAGAEGAAGGVQGDPAGRQGQELPGARHHPDRGALLRQRADVHRGGEAAAAAPVRPVGALHRRHRADLRRAAAPPRRRHQDAVRRPLHLAARRHPGQGRPDVDGALAGGAGAVPGPRGLRRRRQRSRST